MNDRCLEVLNLYDIEVERVVRGRGAYLVWTDKGLFRLSEYTGTEGRLVYEEELLGYICDTGFERVDRLLRTREDKLYGEDVAGAKYIMKRWYEGRECDVKRTQDLVAAVQTLACLHLNTSHVRKESLRSIAPVGSSILTEYSRHNAELKRVRSFIRNRKRKIQFEYDVLEHFEEYYGYAREAYRRMEESNCQGMETDAWDRCSICHGTYNYHNVLVEGNNIAVVNFNHSNKGLQIQDLYFFLRKVMEKHDWNVQLGRQLVEKYQIIRELSKGELKLLQIMISYPEKFWKLLNQYNSSNKSWIPDKNIEKLHVVYRQQELKLTFASKICP